MKACIYLLCITLAMYSCKKDSPEDSSDTLTEEQLKMQGKWVSIYFKRYDYVDGAISRVVEGDLEPVGYVEYYGKNYRYFNGKEMTNVGHTFSFENGELAVRGPNAIYYTKITWQSDDAFIEMRDDGSAAGGPDNRSVFEYFYVRKTN